MLIECPRKPQNIGDAEICVGKRAACEFAADITNEFDRMKALTQQCRQRFD